MVKALRYTSEGPGIDSTLGIYSVAADISVCPGVDSASKNEYRTFLGVKAAGAKGDDLTTFVCRVSRNLGALAQQKPLGPIGL